MSDWQRCIDFVLEREGGYVNHPSDPGGETNWGISKRAHPSVDIRNLTREGAEKIYRNSYWRPCRCDRMRWPLNLTVFDYAVNSGNRTATRALQAALGVTADGAIGNQTLGAMRRQDPAKVAQKIVDRRLQNYVRIVKRKPSSLDFLLGWMRRLIHIVEESHRKE